MSLRERRRAALTLVVVFVLGCVAMVTAVQPSAVLAGERPQGSPAPAAAPLASTAKQAAPRAVDCRNLKCVALTFDDGPGPYTAGIVKALKAKGAKATFFMLGSQVKGREAAVRAVKAAGMEIGNHSFNHPDLSKLGARAIRSQVGRTDAALAKAGVKATLYRPPYGAMSRTVRASLADRPISLWGVDTLDWRTRSTSATLRAASAAPRGAIVLMHDIHGSTAKAVPGIVSALQAKGYHLVTVSELLRAPQPGKVYTGRYAR